MTSITCTLNEDKFSFLITSRPVLIRMGNIAYKICR